MALRRQGFYSRSQRQSALVTSSLVCATPCSPQSPQAGHVLLQARTEISQQGRPGSHLGNPWEGGGTEWMRPHSSPPNPSTPLCFLACSLYIESLKTVTCKTNPHFSGAHALPPLSCHARRLLTKASPFPTNTQTKCCHPAALQAIKARWQGSSWGIKLIAALLMALPLLVRRVREPVKATSPGLGALRQTDVLRVKNVFKSLPHPQPGAQQTGLGPPWPGRRPPGLVP